MGDFTNCLQTEHDAECSNVRLKEDKITLLGDILTFGIDMAVPDRGNISVSLKSRFIKVKAKLERWNTVVKDIC